MTKEMFKIQSNQSYKFNLEVKKKKHQFIYELYLIMIKLFKYNDDIFNCYGFEGCL